MITKTMVAFRFLCLSFIGSLPILFAAGEAQSTTVYRCLNEDGTFTFRDRPCVVARYDQIELSIIEFSRDHPDGSVHALDDHLARGEALLLQEFDDLSPELRASLRFLLLLEPVRLGNVGSRMDDHYLSTLKKRFSVFRKHSKHDALFRKHLDDMITAFPGLLVLSCPEYRSDATRAFLTKTINTAHTQVSRVQPGAAFHILIATYLSIRDSLRDDDFALRDKNWEGLAFRVEESCLAEIARENEAREAREARQRQAGRVKCDVEWVSGLRQLVITYHWQGRVYAISGQARDRARARGWTDGVGQFSPEELRAFINTGLGQCR